jgi:cytochrome c-type biogenesis protein CcmH/NrfF
MRVLNDIELQCINGTGDPISDHNSDIVRQMRINAL